MRWAPAVKGVYWHDACHPDQRRRAGDRSQDGGIFDAVADRGPAVPPAAVPVASGGQDAMAVLATALLPHLEGRIGGGVDPAQVLDLIEQHLNGALLKTVTVVEVHDHVRQDIVDLGIQHRQFPLLLKMMGTRDRKGNRKNIWIAGPAGSGKTSAAAAAAEALGMRFGYNGAIDNPYGLLGFIDATGNYRRTEFREIFEHGGTWLHDECDGSLAQALLPINPGWANGFLMFPDGLVQRHKDCVIIAAANTWGHGATSTYVGRNRLDGATMNRFGKLYWDYDEELELATSGNADWCKHVQRLRANARAKQLQVLITPRATYDGADYLAHGLTWAEVESITVAAEMSPDQWAMISGPAQSAVATQGGLL